MSIKCEASVSFDDTSEWVNIEFNASPDTLGHVGVGIAAISY